jgi:hypothetical protein
VFDGDGHVIRNFVLEGPGDQSRDGLGLFDYVREGTIQNVTMTEFFLRASDVNFNQYVGVLVGASQGATILNIHLESGSAVGGTEALRRNPKLALIAGALGGGLIDGVSIQNSSVAFATNEVGIIIGVLSDPVIGNDPVGTATIRDITISSSSVQGGWTGALVGGVYLSGVSIEDVTITDVSVVGNRSETGGLIGYIYEVFDPVSIVDVTAQGLTVSAPGDVGGVVGGDDAGDFELRIERVSITDALVVGGTIVAGVPAGTPGNNVGGLVGVRTSAGDFVVSDVGFEGAVWGGARVGGLVGSAGNMSMADANFDGTVSATGPRVGGLVGQVSAGSSIVEGHASGSVSSTFVSNNPPGAPSFDWGVGGLVGRMVPGGAISIMDSSFSGDVTALTAWSVGGLVGDSSSGSVLSRVEVGPGTITGNRNVGGAVGTNRSVITDVTVHANIASLQSAGGIVGDNFGPITTARYFGTLIDGGVNAGGFIGWHRVGALSDIVVGSVAAPVTVIAGSQSAVLIGQVDTWGPFELTGAIAFGDVVGQDMTAGPFTLTRDYLGGLVGVLFQYEGYAIEVEDVEWRGSVSGAESVGGVIGGAYLWGNQWADDDTPLSVNSIRDVRVSGSVAGTEGVSGGIGRVFNSSSSQEFESLSLRGFSFRDLSVTGTKWVGGLIGDFELQEVNRDAVTMRDVAFANVAIVGTEQVGGVIGFVREDAVTKLTGLRGVDGSVTGLVAVGGVVGGTAGGPLVISDVALLRVAVEATGTNWEDAGNVGGVVGDAWNGSVALSDVRLTSVDVVGAWNAGGLVGQATDVSVVGAVLRGVDVAAFGANVFGTVLANVGGLVGFVVPAVEMALVDVEVVDASVSGVGINVGGVLGGVQYTGAAGTFVNLLRVALDAVRVEGSARFVGGLVGDASYQVRIVESSVQGSVLGDGSVGGLVGRMQGGADGWEGSIERSWFVGDVVGSGVDGRVGGLAGEVEFAAVEVVSSWASGSVSASGAGDVGGLVGRLMGGSVVTSFAVVDVLGGVDVGGLVGSVAWSNFASGGLVRDSYALGRVEGVEGVGGLVGRWAAQQSNAAPVVGEIVSSFAAGVVVGDVDVGGLVGVNADGSLGNVRVAFWDVEASGLGGSAGGVGVSTVVLQSLVTFVGAGWDIDVVFGGNVWAGCDGNYPVLVWQGERALRCAVGLVFVEQPGVAVVGEWFAPEVVVHVVDGEGGVVAVSGEVVVSLGGSAGEELSFGEGAALRGNESVVSVGGVAQFPFLRVDRVGSFTLRGRLGDLVGVSDSFVVVAAEPVGVVVRPEPVTFRGSPFAVSLGLVDARGNPAVSLLPVELMLSVVNESVVAGVVGAVDGGLVDEVGDAFGVVVVPAGVSEVVVSLAYLGVSDPGLGDDAVGDVVLRAVGGGLSGSGRFVSRDVVVGIEAVPGPVVVVDSWVSLVVSLSSGDGLRGWGGWPLSLSTSAGSFVGGGDAVMVVSGDDGSVVVPLRAPVVAGVGVVSVGCGVGCSGSLELLFVPGAVEVVRFVAGDGQSTAPGSLVDVAPVVRVEDRFGNGVEGVDVALSVAPGDGVVVPGVVRSGVGGLGLVESWRVGAALGVHSLMAVVVGSDPVVGDVITAVVSQDLSAPVGLVGVAGRGEAWVVFDVPVGVDEVEVQLTNPPVPFGDVWVGVGLGDGVLPLRLNGLVDGVMVEDGVLVCVRVRVVRSGVVGVPSEVVCVMPRGDVAYGSPTVELRLVESEGGVGGRLGSDGLLSFDFVVVNEGGADLRDVWLKPFVPVGSSLVGLESLSGGSLMDFGVGWFWRDVNLAAGGGSASLRFVVRLEGDEWCVGGVWVGRWVVEVSVDRSCSSPAHARDSNRGGSLGALVDRLIRSWAGKGDVLPSDDQAFLKPTSSTNRLGSAQLLRAGSRSVRAKSSPTWLEAHHADADELWVGYHERATGTPSLTAEGRMRLAGARLLLGWPNPSASARAAAFARCWIGRIFAFTLSTRPLPRPCSRVASMRPRTLRMLLANRTIGCRWALDAHTNHGSSDTSLHQLPSGSAVCRLLLLRFRKQERSFVTMNSEVELHVNQTTRRGILDR